MHGRFVVPLSLFLGVVPVIPFIHRLFHLLNRPAATLQCYTLLTNFLFVYVFACLSQPYQPRCIFEEYTDPQAPKPIFAAAASAGAGFSSSSSSSATVHSLLMHCDPDAPALQVTFVPPPAPNEEAQPCELVVIIDRSGSMSGSRIECVKETLHLILHSLPAGCYFNFVSFGSSFSKLWPSSRVYSEATLQEAENYVNTMKADMV